MRQISHLRAVHAEERAAAQVAAAAAVPLLVPTLPTLAQLRPYIARIDRNHWYSNFGPLVNELEERLGLAFAEMNGSAPEIVTVSNATIGLELALRALDLPAGAIVLVPAFTFVATAAAVRSAGLVPRCVDVDPDTWQLTPGIAREEISRVKVDAVMPVCVFGREQPGEDWSAFHAETGIPVIIDAAAAFGNQWDPGPTCAVFSMHATKPLAAGEGGFVATRSSVFARSVRQRTNFGINLTQPEVAGLGTVTMAGVNGKLSEYHAAVAHASLDAWTVNARARRRLYAEYSAAISNAGQGRLTWQSADGNTVRSVCTFLAESEIGRDRAEAALTAAGVSTRRWYCPTVDRHPAFCHFDHAATPVARRLAERLLGVPFYIGLDKISRRVVSTTLAKSLVRT